VAITMTLLSVSSCASGRQGGGHLFSIDEETESQRCMCLTHKVTGSSLHGVSILGHRPEELKQGVKGGGAAEESQAMATWGEAGGHCKVWGTLASLKDQWDVSLFFSKYRAGVSEPHSCSCLPRGPGDPL
jgi:hypothetical protein